ncbi:uncharacterized protein LOC143612107 [Bidens hawaiensis]|uniref:uncharacterized protein LOC143612107 n=1 Tax=Bidens hawaiensis TaxID=980011 RepID=UPI0040493799
MEATVSRKTPKLGCEDEENVVELKSKRYGDSDVNLASTASDLKAVCDSEAEADMFLNTNDGFRDEDEDIMISGAVKRRKLGFEDKSRDGDVNVNFNENVASTTSFSGTSDHVNSVSDLKAVCVSEADKFVSGNERFNICSRDTCTSSVVMCFESEEMESSSTTEIEASSCRKLPPVTVVTMPSAAELEEFFAEAEKYEQKRLAEKYNFDIKKDVPMEGRYQWVPLNP